jgi:hypothetical protein
MNKYAKSLLAIAVLSAVCSSAQAFIVPNTDFKKFSIMVMDDVNRSMEFIKKTGLYQAIDAARAYDYQARIDGWNNGAANWVARVNQQATDVFMLNQKANSMPSQDACSTVSVQGGLAEAVCGEGGIADAVAEQMGISDAGPLEILQKAKTIVGSLLPKVIGAAAPGSGSGSGSGAADADTESTKAYKRFVADEIAAVDKNKAWVDAGKALKANDPTLLLVTSDMAPAYSPEELEMALNMARLTYPPFVRKYGEDPVNEREAVQDLRKKLRIETANATIARQIGMRTSLDPNKPSKLMALGMPVAIKFDGNSEIDTTGESWIHKVALNNNTTPAEMSKESLLMTGLKFNQALERYKSQLVTEQMMLNRYLVKLETPAKRG